MDGIERLRAERAAARDRIGRAAGRAVAALSHAHAAEAGIRRRLDEALAGLEDTPAARIGQLDGGIPVALLPARIETRFRRLDGSAPDQTSGGELWVRIYPDGLLADDHEPLLSAAEVAAGADYWRRAFAAGDERDAWTALLAETTPERAAWVVTTMTLGNVAVLGTGAEPELPDPPVRPDGWHRAPEARGLPERWIVSAFRGGQRVHQAVSGPVREGLALGLRLSGDDGDGAAESGTNLSGDGLAVAPELAWTYDLAEAERAGMAVRIPLTGEDFDSGFDTVLVLGVRTVESAPGQAAELARLLDAHRYSRGLAFVPQGARTNNTAARSSDHPPAVDGGPVGSASRSGSRRRRAARGEQST